MLIFRLQLPTIRRVAAIVWLFCCFFTTQASFAQSFSTIRDAEIEQYLADITNPIIDVAGLQEESIKTFIVQSDDLNAFVTGGQNMFIHTGLIQEGDSPLILQGVIAHELGHIAGGHLVRRTGHAKKAGIEAAVGYILGIGSVLLGGSPEAATALVAGGQHIAQRGLLKYTRHHEEAADQSALNYLDELNISPQGLKELLETLWADQRTFFHNNKQITRYDLTHPPSPERISHINGFIAGRDFPPGDPTLTHRHRMIVAKLDGFLKEPQKVFAQYNDDNSLYGRYAKAVAYYRVPQMDKALAAIDGLIAQEPANPYFHELRGQMLYENGRIAEAIPSYEKALSILEDNALLQLELAVAYIAMEDEIRMRQAIPLLHASLTTEPRNSFAWWKLGIAHGKLEEFGPSYLALAQRERLRRNNKGAKEFVAKARQYIQEGSPAWLRSDDLLADIKREEKQ